MRKGSQVEWLDIGYR